MTEEIAVRTEAPPAPPIAERRLTVFARNPQEMNVAQGQLVGWTLAKLGEIRMEELDLKENLEVATKNGWRTTTLKRQLSRTARRLEFYEKVKAALDAGYCIIPNFPIDVFAIRTERGTPVANMERSGGNWRPAIGDQQSESPPIGEGAFVAARADVATRQVQVALKDGKQETRVEAWAESFRDVDFPFAFAQPAVLEATQRALVDRVFDELGASPTQARRGRGDPMVIGRIYAPHGQYDRNTKCLSFVVAWFLRPDRDLDF